jgi:hypothetical protein
VFSCRVLGLAQIWRAVPPRKIHLSSSKSESPALSCTEKEKSIKFSGNIESDLSLNSFTEKFPKLQNEMCPSIKFHNEKKSLLNYKLKEVYVNRFVAH